jgi:hypothetical protein
MKRMKKPVLVLLALLVLLPFAQLMAQTPPAAVPPAAPTPADAAQFLATLSGGQAQSPSDLVPTPAFMTGCTSQCPTGQLCCMMCGNPPDDGGSCMACVTPINGRCPRVV